MRRLLGAAAVAVCLGALTASAGAQGGQTSANMQVNANVIRKCTISAQPLAFGNYDPVGANATSPLDGQTTLTVACTKGTAVNIAMDGGANAQGQTRRMVAATNYLLYEVYQDANRTQRWGDTGSELFPGGIAPSRDPRQFTVYGRVPANQDVPEGSFQDLILVTVHF
jgi:spore coat protein U-like protein